MWSHRWTASPSRPSALSWSIVTWMPGRCCVPCPKRWIRVDPVRMGTGSTGCECLLWLLLMITDDNLWYRSRKLEETWSLSWHRISMQQKTFARRSGRSARRPSASAHGQAEVTTLHQNPVGSKIYRLRVYNWTSDFRISQECWGSALNSWYLLPHTRELMKTVQSKSKVQVCKKKKQHHHHHFKGRDLDLKTRFWVLPWLL